MYSSDTRILIVDDMMTMRKIVRKTLKEIGLLEVTEAKDGRDAWEKITNAEPGFQLIISDWNMPEVSGLELLRRVRADSTHKSLPFVMLTAESEKDQIMEAINAGVDTYIVKPFNSNTMKDKLQEVHQKTTG